MPSRSNPLLNSQIYHIYNIGVEKRRIFESRRDYQRFLKALIYYSVEGPKPRFSHYSENNETLSINLNNKIVDIIAFILMPNHFHLLLRQRQSNGISQMLGQLSNSYTKFFNAKYKRNGSLFQREFKSALVEKDERLLYVLRHLHRDPITSFLSTNLTKYEWSSYHEYLQALENPNLPNPKTICQKTLVLENYQTKADFQKFTEDKVGYLEKLPIIHHQILED